MEAFVLRGMLLVASLAVVAPTYGKEISCPNVLQTTVQSGSPIPDGWLARNSSLKHTLNGVRINFGDPQIGSDGAIYDRRLEEREADDVEVETLIWDLAQMRDPFLVCSYFGTNVVLTRSVSGMSQCKAVIARSRRSARVEIRSAVCTSTSPGH